MNSFENGPSEQDIAWQAEKPKRPENLNGTAKYETKNGEKVDLQWEAVYPEEGYDNNTEAIIFLPGVALDANSASVLDTTKNLADVSKLISYSITTRLESDESENSQSLQAEAIQKFVAEKGLKQVTLVGNSQGANKAMFVNSELKHNNPDITIRGLILTSPGGLYDQGSSELSKNFFKDSLLNTSPTIIKESKFGSVHKFKNTLGRIGRAIKIGNDVGIGIGKELLKAPSEFGKRATRESTEAATLNPHTDEVESPIVIILGDKDMAFESDKLIPENAHDKNLESQRAREEVMKKIFPNSPAIRVLEGSKDSVHGMHYIRGKKVPSSGWHMLERMERET